MADMLLRKGQTLEHIEALWICGQPAGCLACILLLWTKVIINCGPKERLSSKAPAAAEPAAHAEVAAAEAAPRLKADWELALPLASESRVSWAIVSPEAP